MPRLTRRDVLARLRRPGEDSGVVATIVVVLLAGGVLLAMAALTVDVGRLYAERRQLQNGADAGALAVAIDCAKRTTCDTSTGSAGNAGKLADQNAADGTSAVTSVCGTGRSSLPVCAAQTTPTITRCPAVPAGTSAYARVTTRTRATSGASLLPPVFARSLVGNGAYAGSTVYACAQAAWGQPGALAITIPLTFSLCEWSAWTSNGTSYAPPPPYTPPPATYPSSTYEHALKFHTVNDKTGCPSVGGSFADLPGGFGWLNGGGTCTVTISATGWVQADTGVSGSSCADLIASAVGKLVYIPIFTAVTGSGSTGQYKIDGFAAFFVTGYSIPGVSPNSRKSIATGTRYCSGADKCVYGYFTEALVPTAAVLGSGGTDRGANVVQLIG